VFGYFIHFLGRLFGILMGWRRAHRPGELTARIFMEHDRALAKVAMPKVHHPMGSRSKFRSAARIRPDIRARRITLQQSPIVLRPSRASLVRSPAICQRPAPGERGKPAKRVARRVVWLEKASRTIPPIENTTRSTEERSNVIALHRLDPAPDNRNSKAAASLAV